MFYTRMEFRAAVIIAVVAVAMTFETTPTRAIQTPGMDKMKVSCVLVFGDSSVDPGNNNNLKTVMKGNFPPYGKDFFSGRSTGRFSNGRLATDFIAESLGNSREVPGFLDRKARSSELTNGVSFASAGSGYDDLTANISNVLSLGKQMEDLGRYKVWLRRKVGEKKAEEMVRNGLFVLSMGTNDFIQNYFLKPFRAKQFTLEEYLDYLVICMRNTIKEMGRNGAKRLVVVGVPPLGCMPLVKTLNGTTECVGVYNRAALSLSLKIKKEIQTLGAQLGMKTAFIDIYGIMIDAINNPSKFGLVETRKGCCGSGLIEVGETCKNVKTCSNADEFVFWDAVHPTQKIYKIVCDRAMYSISDLFS